MAARTARGGHANGRGAPVQRLPSGEADKCSSAPEGSGKKDFCRTQACGSAGRPACLRRHTFLSSARKVCKRSSLKEENPFDWVFSLKDPSFLNDQSGGGPFGNPELWRGACRGCPHSRQAKRHSIALLAVHEVRSFVVSPVRGRVALAWDDGFCTRQTGCAGRAALRRVGAALGFRAGVLRGNFLCWRSLQYVVLKSGKRGF